MICDAGRVLFFANFLSRVAVCIIRWETSGLISTNIFSLKKETLWALVGYHKRF